MWATKVIVTGAYALRLHLTGVSLPKGTRFWTYGTDQKFIAFGLDLASPQGDLWSPTIFGEVVNLVVEIPPFQTSGGFTIADVVQRFRANDLGIKLSQGIEEPSCLVDATCVSTSDFAPIRLVQKAVAQLGFVQGTNMELCTGTLLNNAKADGTPYLITANHCLPTGTGAASLEAFWDYYDTTCGGTSPDPSVLPRSDGGTILASSSVTDFAFIRLSTVPPGRVFLGWDARPSSVAGGVQLFRVSNPLAVPQQFSASVVDSLFLGCTGADRPNFLTPHRS